MFEKDDRVMWLPGEITVGVRSVPPVFGTVREVTVTEYIVEFDSARGAGRLVFIPFDEADRLVLVPAVEVAS